MKKKLFPIIATLALGAVFAFAGCGEDGKSAYQIWLDNGNSGTEQDFLNSLKGQDGANGEQGDKGDKGDKGDPGEPGAPGEPGGILDADCTHVFVDHVLEYATCCQPKVVAHVCTLCNGYKVEVGETNPDVHGYGYEWVETADHEMKLVLDASCLEIIPGTEFEEANGACKKQKCNACGEMLKQHATTAWYPVDENANICEEEHLEVEACTLCHAAVSKVQTKGARGHAYNTAPDKIVIGAAITNGYEVTLTCDTCGESITVNATVKSEKVANCEEGGYKIYEYTFNNYLENITAEFKYDIVPKTTEHTFSDGTNSIMVNQGAHLNFIPSNTATLKALIEAGIIRWTEGEPGDCVTEKVVGGDCAVCNELVTFNLFGEHTFPATAPAVDCVTDGEFVCSACSFTTPGELATGHVWTYKSVDTTAGTMTVSCSCGATDTVAYTHTETTAENCQTFAQDVYTATFSNGLPAGHANLATQTIVKKINKAEQKAHTIGSLKIKQGENREYNDTFDALIAEGKIRWTEGEPGICSEKKIAGFDCSVCGNLVTFNLSGEHTLNGTDDVTAPTCTTRGVTTQACVNCGIDVEVAAVDAKGHTYVADAASLAAFVAAPANGGSVVFNCACGDSITLNAVLTTADSQNGCVTIKKSTYTFTKTYTVESAVVGETISKTFTYTYVVDKSSGSHTLGEIKNLQQGGTYEYNDKFAAALEAGTLRWAEGEPSACNEHWVAGFDCTVCGHLVTINLSGEHNIANATLQTKDATCTAAGYTYKVCADCGIEIVIDEIPALGHNVEWSVIGADKDNAGYAEGICSRCNNSVQVNGTVKERVEASCGKDGYVIYQYVDANGNKVVEDKEFVLPRTGLHDNTAPLTRIEFVENGWKYVAYFCEVCECYVVESKVKA